MPAKHLKMRMMFLSKIFLFLKKIENKPSIMKKYVLITIFLLISFKSLAILAINYETYIIIVGGGKTPEDAQLAKKNYLKQTELTEQIDANFQILLSDTIQGLNPGFHIAIMGFCNNVHKAKLLTNFANRYLKGVYYKKVTLKTKEKSPVFKPIKAPFSGKTYYLHLSAFKTLYNDLLYWNKASSSYETIILVNNTIVYSEKQGLVDVNYYLGWIEKNKEVVFINQFQFTRLFFGEEWIPECKVDETEVEYSPEFTASERKEECSYPNGVRSFSDQGYEWDVSSISFPLDKFSFEEVFNYYAGQGYFHFIFKDSKLPVSDGYCNYFYEVGKKVGMACDHEEDYIQVHDDEIVYYVGGGA
jgi:hypothetical protein